MNGSKYYQKGQALSVLWNFYKPDNTPFNLSGLSVRLLYSCNGRQAEANSFVLSGNNLSWTFPAELQRFTGDYSLHLVIYNFNLPLCRMTYYNAFTLSDMGLGTTIVSQQQNEGNVVVLNSVAQFYQFSPVIPVVGENGHWWVNGEDTGIDVAVNVEGYVKIEDFNALAEIVNGISGSVEQLGGDMDGKMNRVPGATGGNFAAFDNHGNIVDSDRKPSDFLTEHQSLANYPTRSEMQSAVAGVVGVQFKDVETLPTASAATGGKICLLPVPGTATKEMWVTVEDGSSYSWLRIGTTSVDVSGKADKVVGAVAGNFPMLDATGNIVDSNKKPGDFLTQHQDISGKADKVVGGTTGNFPVLDQNGNLVDSNKKPSDFLTEHQSLDNYYTKGEVDSMVGNIETLLSSI